MADGGSFPVDDTTLDMLDAAIDGTLLDDGRSSLGEFLDFMSGYDAAKVVDLGGGISEYQGGPVYHPHDVIRALITEVRRLRQPQLNDGSDRG